MYARAAAARCDWRHRATPSAPPRAMPPPAAAPKRQRRSWPTEPAACLAAAEAALRRDRLDWEALFTRACAANACGKPLRAVADLQRLLRSGSLPAPPSAPLTAEATRALEQLMRQYSSAFFERFVPPDSGEAKAPESAADSQQGTGGPVLKPCVKRLRASFLFREGLPCRATPRADARYTRSVGRSRCGRAASTPPPTVPQRAPFPRLEGGSAAGCAAAVAAAAAREPFWLCKAHGLGTAWGSGDFLAAQLGDFTCHVLSAPASSSRFTYYWGLPGDTVHDKWEAPPAAHSDCSMLLPALSAPPI